MTAVNKKRILIIVFLSSIFLVTRFQNVLPDVDYINGDAGGRYYPLATNLAAGNGFSLEKQPPFIPDDFNQPAYPYFVALIYRMFGGSNTAVSVAQSILELSTILIALKLARKFGFSNNETALVAFLATISPFLAIFSNRLLTEVLATFASMLLCYLLIVAAENTSLKIWTLSAAVAGLCLLIRPDLLVSLLLMVSAALTTLTIKFRLRAAPSVALFVVILALVMTPWTLRNYNLTGKILPLGRVTEQTDLSYVKWLNTWLVEPLDMPPFWWGRMQLEIPFNSSAATESFAEDKIRAEELLAAAQSQNSFEGAPSDGFARLAVNAYDTRPVKSHLIVPVERTAMTVARMPNYVEDESNQTLTYSFWLPLAAASLLGMIIMSAQRIFLIPSALFLGRLFLPFYTAIGAEPRYIIESLPILYISGAAGICWLVRRIQTLRQSSKAGKAVI